MTGEWASSGVCWDRTSFESDRLEFGLAHGPLGESTVTSSLGSFPTLVSFPWGLDQSLSRVPFQKTSVGVKLAQDLYGTRKTSFEYPDKRLNALGSPHDPVCFSPCNSLTL